MAFLKIIALNTMFQIVPFIRSKFCAVFSKNYYSMEWMLDDSLNISSNQLQSIFLILIIISSFHLLLNSVTLYHVWLLSLWWSIDKKSSTSVKLIFLMWGKDSIKAIIKFDLHMTNARKCASQNIDDTNSNNKTNNNKNNTEPENLNNTQHFIFFHWFDLII